MSNNNTFATVAIALVIFVCGFLLGYLMSGMTGQTIEETASEARDMMTGTNEGEEAAAATPNGDAVAFTINVENIPESQRAFLRTMGIEGNEIVVTNAMLACAEAEIGVARMEEIRYGATPSASEGLKLAGCY